MARAPARVFQAWEGHSRGRWYQQPHPSRLSISRSHLVSVLLDHHGRRTVQPGHCGIRRRAVPFKFAKKKVQTNTFVRSPPCFIRLRSFTMALDLKKVMQKPFIATDDMADNSAEAVRDDRTTSARTRAAHSRRHIAPLLPPQVEVITSGVDKFIATENWEVRRYILLRRRAVQRAPHAFPKTRPPFTTP